MESNDGHQSLFQLPVDNFRETTGRGGPQTRKQGHPPRKLFFGKSIRVDQASGWGFISVMPQQSLPKFIFASACSAGNSLPYPDSLRIKLVYWWGGPNKVPTSCNQDLLVGAGKCNPLSRCVSCKRALLRIFPVNVWSISGNGTASRSVPLLIFSPTTRVSGMMMGVWSSVSLQLTGSTRV